jgi:disulfide bond formation protein DsbB
VSTETAQLFSGLLTVATALLGISVIVLRLATAAGDERARRVGSAVSDAGIWLAFLIATGSMLGSLWFSEVADFVPCRLCWFQRIAMYPLVAVLFVGAIRRDPAVRWYAGPIALVGAGIAGYHTLIEWRPSLDTGVCELTGPSCTFVWFREFGFISLATMALTAFLTILILLFVRFPARLDAATPEVEMETVS